MTGETSLIILMMDFQKTLFMQLDELQGFFSAEARVYFE